MRILGGLCVTLLLSGGLFAQHGNFVNPTPVVTGGFGNVVFPGGTAATVPGINRTTPQFASPLGGPRLVTPNAFRPLPRRQNSAPLLYSYPVVVGGYDYSGYGSGYGAPPEAAPQQPPNVTVVYPPQPAPVIINQYGPPDANAAARPRLYEMPQGAPQPQAETQPEPAPVETTHYLIAFKDHSIYSAVNYWVDGNTLHYFTDGNVHNQASLSLVDRDLTLRLNRESGVDIKIPAPK